MSDNSTTALAESEAVVSLEPTTVDESAHFAPASAPLSERLTPREWAARKGDIEEAEPSRPWRSPNVHYRYAAADALYGWTHHAYHYQAEGDRFLILEADYDAALAAAVEYPAKPPHRAAIAPSCPHAFRAEFQPAEANAHHAKESR